MVSTESTMLGADDLYVDRTKARRVQFSGVDGSSIYPPVDREFGSDESLQEAIEALKSAKEVIQSLPKSVAPILEELVAYLKDSSIFNACAAAMSDYADYPVKRVETAAKLFVHDFEIVLDRIRGLPEDALTPLRRADAVKSEKPLKFIEENLAVRVGLAIRYYLRVLFNPSPPSITTIDADREAAHLVTLSKYSGVCDLIEFVDDDGEDHHGDVTCLSAYVSKSIQRIYEYLLEFHDKSPLLDDISNIELPDGFCTSQAAGMTIPTRARDFPDEHFDATQRDILEATYFIAASRSARFIVDLCSAPGVADEIKRMGGWDSIQTYATMSWQHDLYRHCDADAHLVALSNFDTFLENLEELADRMDCLRAAAAKALERVKKNYRFSTTSKKILEAFPRITELKTIYQERMELASNIPVIQPAQPESLA